MRACIHQISLVRVHSVRPVRDHNGSCARVNVLADAVYVAAPFVSSLFYAGKFVLDEGAGLTEWAGPLLKSARPYKHVDQLLKHQRAASSPSARTGESDSTRHHTSSTQIQSV